MEQVVVTIERNGAVQIEVNGVTGGRCKDVTAQLERALGVSGSSEEKPEFYQEATQGQSQG